MSVGIGMSSPARIDEINILQATYEAMRHAVEDLDAVPDLLLNDAVTIPLIPIRQVGIVKGDARSLSIAVAKHYGKGYEGPHDGRIRRTLSGVRL